jgi:hypothetical protein
MSRAESTRQSGKFSRKYSEMTIDSKYTRSTFEEGEETAGRGRRKVSMDQLREQQRRWGADDRGQLEAKCNFRLSTEVLSFEMEEQRNHQLRIIHGNPQLLAYYSCLKKLFMILYQASIPLNENKFNISVDTLNNNNLQILAILFDQDSTEWNLKYIKSL